MFHARARYLIPTIILICIVLRGLSYLTMADTSPNNFPIELSLSSITILSNDEPPTISLKVTLKNTSDKPLSFLRWSTPFDTSAVRMGIFKFKSLNTGEYAPCLDMKLNRRIPESGIFPEDQIEYIEAGSELSKEIQVKAPDVVLSKTERYEVTAKGNWMHVIEGKQTDTKTREEDILRGRFESNSVVLDFSN